MLSSSNIASILKPNAASLGYALFLAVNAAGVWGGIFPFLSLEFQKPAILFWFFSAQSIVFSLSYFVSALGVYFIPGPTRRFFVALAAAPYFFGWCCLIGAIYIDTLSLELMVLGGALLGLGPAGFFMLWQRLFASFDADRGNHDLIQGTAYAAVLYFALYLIPQAVTAFLIPLVFLPLFGLSIILLSRKIHLDQPMFEDIPREHPQVYRTVLRDYWRSALCVGALGFCTGIMRSLAIGDVEAGSLVNMLSMAGSFVASLTLLMLWQVNNLRLNVVAAYRVFFPFVITSFLLLPLLASTYARWLAAVLYAVYSVGIMLMMIQCAQAARDRGINPVFIYGFFAGIVYLLHDLGFIGGTLVEALVISGLESLGMVALVAVYLLGLMYFVGQGGFRKIFKRDETAENIELVALRPSLGDAQDPRKAVPAIVQERVPEQPNYAKYPRKENQFGGVVRNSPPRGAGDGEPFYQDRISKQAALLQHHYRLSARETEVMELLARGNTVARIAGELIVSENTIRTHSKRIYAKLDIHKKQDLLDLIDTFDPHDLSR